VLGKQLHLSNEQLLEPHGENPYYEEMLRWPRDEIAWTYDHRWEPATLSVPYHLLSIIPREQIRERTDLCIQYSWSIPDPASLAFVASHLGRMAVEIGAGTGYYASLLAKLGTYVICYDKCPPHRSGGNFWHSPRHRDEDILTWETRSVYHGVYHGDHNKAARYTCPLFLCWPPYAQDMAYKTLKAYAGTRLVYVGEGPGGCTADDNFFALLDREWEQIAEHRPLQWSGIHDWITVYDRVRACEVGDSRDVRTVAL